MTEKDNRNNDGRKPDIWKKGDGAGLQFGRQIRAESRKRGNCRNHDIEKQKKRENVPADQKRAINFSAAKRKKINNRRGNSRKNIEISSFKSHRLRNQMILKKPE